MAKIRTFMGKMVDLEKPTVDAIDVRDIAHALGNINRFTGHTKRPYMVAEHSVIGSYFVPEKYALEFLLHDAQEAYLGDVSSPLKSIIGKRYAELEADFVRVIAKKFRLSATALEDVRRVDALMLACELRVVMNDPVVDYASPSHEVVRIVKMLADGTGVCSEFTFLNRFKQLIDARMPDITGGRIDG